MYREILPYGVAVALAAAWATVVPWLLALRKFGRAVPFNPFKRRKANLNIGGNMFEGVVLFGVSLAIFGLAHRYLRWRLFGTPADQPTTNMIADEVFSSLLVGLLLGLFNSATIRKMCE
jgi:hypothetical protein